MIHKENPPNISPSDPWAEDIFSRQGEGKILCELIARSSPGPITISLQSPWGSGKTVFLQRIAAELRNTHFIKTISIDAWKSDHHGDPLVPMLTTLTEMMDSVRAEPSLPEKAKERIGKAVSAVADVGVKFILPGAGMVANVLAPGSGAIAAGTAKIGERALKDQRERMKAAPLFRDALIEARDVITQRPKASPIRPILIIVDELDRCRPDYAILMLERIKHYFDIQGIIFLISTDHGNLPSAVKTVYGDHVNGEEYLRKFFDYQFYLSPTSHMALSNHLVSKLFAPEIAKYSTESLANSPSGPNRRPSAEEYDKGEYIQYFGDMADAFNLSARDQIQAFTMLTAYLYTRPENSHSIPIIDCFLICLRFGAPEVFRDIVNSGRVHIPTDFNGNDHQKLAGISRKQYHEPLQAFFSGMARGLPFKELGPQMHNKLFARSSTEARSKNTNDAINLLLRRLNKLPNHTAKMYTLNVVRLAQAFSRPVEDEIEE